jgi:hypothetical protein
MLTGGCLCSAVRYETEGPFDPMLHCHCSMCRKVHGAAFATFMGAPAATFRFVRGEEHVRRYRSSSSVDRTFCDTCGSSLQFLWLPRPDKVWLAAGTLDDDPGVRPRAHIFVASKAPWFDVSDDLPQYAADVT